MDTLKQKMQFLRVCLILLLLPLNMWAQSIDESVARERAQAFLQERNAGKPKATWNSTTPTRWQPTRRTSLPCLTTDGEVPGR